MAYWRATEMRQKDWPSEYPLILFHWVRLINKPVSYKKPLSVKWRGGEVKVTNIYWPSAICQPVSSCFLVSLNPTAIRGCRNNYSSFTTSKQRDLVIWPGSHRWCLNRHLSPRYWKELLWKCLWPLEILISVVFKISLGWFQIYNQDWEPVSSSVSTPYWSGKRGLLITTRSINCTIWSFSKESPF